MGTLEHRVPPPIVFVILAAAMLAGSHLSAGSPLGSSIAPAAEWRRVVADCFAWLALIVAVSGIVAFRRAGTTIDPIHLEAASTLVTTGIFRFTRNPMYLGLTCLLVAWSVYLTHPLTVLGPAAFILFITRFQIIPEERVLQRKFGAAYESYRSRVRRWL
jgi:protein-S-isoprenylcysteine O-methyltransferase Ste14